MRNRGFSLIDMVVAIGVGGVVLLIFMNVISFMRMTEAKYRMKADSRITRSLGERFLWMGMKNAAPSFNTILVNDDAGRPFFDLNRDDPTPSPIPPNRKRSITLSRTSVTKTFIALLTNTNVADASAGLPSIVYLDPAKLFPISAAPPTATPFSWNMFKNFIDSVNKNMLTPTGAPIFMEVFMPSSFRTAAQTTANPPNPASFFISYKGGAFATETFGGRYIAKHAVNPAIPIPDLDQFIKRMPSASGGIPPLMARVVRLVQYEVYPDPVRKEMSRLTRTPPEPAELWHLRYQTWNGVQFANPIMIADDIRGVTFSRDDIGDPSIKINLDKEEK